MKLQNICAVTGINPFYIHITLQTKNEMKCKFGKCPKRQGVSGDIVLQ